MPSTLRITEIFFSLQGEARTVGIPTVFVRLTGCPLRCLYCDSAYAFSGGQSLSLSAIIERVAQYSPQYVCVTGGEPLAQPGVHSLLTALCDRGYQVSLETSGALDVSNVDARVSRVVDVKTPASGESARNSYANLAKLGLHDQVKFVICSEDDYHWSVSKCLEHDLVGRVGEVLFSPSYGVLEPRVLADWIVRDNLRVRLQLQLHKLLWNDEKGR